MGKAAAGSVIEILSPREDNSNPRRHGQKARTLILLLSFFLHIQQRITENMGSLYS